MNGRIDSFRNQYGAALGPLRVWLKDQNIPGIAMSRSIGDNIATSVGVTWEPEIFQYFIEPHDKFILIASDGVFEFLDSEYCVNLISGFYDRNDLEGACDRLMYESHKSWINEDDSTIDDITFILIFLHYDEI
jgi:serine/threonine protein phosphatase PrpC